MKIGLKKFASVIHNEKRIMEKGNHILETLNREELGEFFFLKNDEERDLTFQVILTGGIENLFLDELDKMNDPQIILFDSTDNSLAATLEIKTKLKDLGRKSLILPLEGGREELENSISVVSAIKKIKGSRIGSVGMPSSWLIASIPDRDKVKEQFGIDIIDIELQELYSEVEKVKDEDVADIKEEFTKNAKKIVEPQEGTIIGSIKIYIALKNIVKKYNLQGVTLSCFTILDVLKNTGCFALSKLNDEGIIAGCEGDLESTITMFIIYHLTGEIPFMANPSSIDKDENSLVLAHCTIARKLLNNYTIRSHFESGIGVGIEGEIDGGDITLFRIGGKNMDKNVLFTGELIPVKHSENLCRTQIKVKLNENVGDLLENPAGNHMVVIKGDHKDLITKFLQVL